jgi:hypothetical protein
VAEEFEYASDKNTQWLDAATLHRLLPTEISSPASATGPSIRPVLAQTAREPSR